MIYKYGPQNSQHILLIAFFVFVHMGPSRNENFPKVFKLFLNFLPNGPHKTFRIFKILSFRFLTIFFFEKKNFKFTIVAYGEAKNLIYIWKTSDRRAKRSEIWDPWVVNQHIRGTFGLLAFKVFFRSFGAFAIFRNLDLMVGGRRIHFEWL